MLFCRGFHPEAKLSQQVPMSHVGIAGKKNPWHRHLGQPSLSDRLLEAQVKTPAAVV